jgi:small subunit ribosomal protein S4
MARYTGPKDRLSRREGVDLFGKGAKLTRLNIPPGVHGPKGVRRKESQYGKQLREKQKVKRMYGLLEGQFKGYITSSLKAKGNTPDTLFGKLESRLDNVVYRLGFAATRAQARQLVSHKHVYVDGKKVNIPSYHVGVGQTITLSKKAMEIDKIATQIKNKDFKVVDWLTRRAAAGKMNRMPIRDDVFEPIEDQDIIEFYSR